MTVFGDEHYLEFAPKPEACRLRRYGELEDVASESSSVVEKLREAGMRELMKRGVHPLLMNWMESEGESRFPSELCGWRGPRGYRHYWQNAYNKW